MFKVDNKDTRNTPRSRSGAFIVNFEHISHLALINNRTTRTGCEICFKLKIKTPEWCHWHEGWTYEDEHISHLVLFGVRTRFSKKKFPGLFTEFSFKSDDFFLTNFWRCWRWKAFLQANCIVTTEFMRMKQDKLQTVLLQKTIKVKNT